MRIDIMLMPALGMFNSLSIFEITGTQYVRKLAILSTSSIADSVARPFHSQWPIVIFKKVQLEDDSQ